MNSERILARQFKQIHDQFEKSFNQKLKAVDLTLSQVSVLLFLTEHQGEKINQKDVGEFLKLQHSTVIGILKRLEAKGFIQCLVDSNNRRCRNVVLTSKAIELEKDINKHCNRMDKHLIKNLSDDEAEELNKLLQKVISGITELEE